MDKSKLANIFKYNICSNHRTVVCLIGGKSRMPDLYSLFNRFSRINRVVWCYKNKETSVESILKKQKALENDSLFLRWIKELEPEYFLYKETNRLLGRTIDMLILENIEFMQPNTLATCTETVRGGGLIIFLFSTVESMESLLESYSDSFYNKRTFNFLVSESSFLFLDKNLEALKEIQDCPELPVPAKKEIITSNDSEFVELGKTSEQRSAIKSIIEITTKSDRFKIALVSSRGRGKSSTLGLSISYYLVKGNTDVKLYALHIDHVQVLFEYVIIGFEYFGYKKSLDFKVIYQFHGKKRFISKILFLEKKIEYCITSESSEKESEVLVVFDEVTSMPLSYIIPLIDGKKLLIATTTGGYEGTGNYFQIKLQKLINPITINLEEPIRYSKGDPMEKWIGRFLLLEPSSTKITEYSPPEICKLYHVNKSILFSGFPATEKILSSVFSLLKTGHYKASPNDLRVLAENTSHQLFIYMNGKQEIVSLIHISIEGITDYTKKDGNIIPWIIEEVYHDKRFFNMRGLRIVRIVTHPDIQSMGYGSSCLKKLENNIRLGIKPVMASEGIKDSDIIPAKKNILLNEIHNVTFPIFYWIGTSFSLTERLLMFWKKNGYYPATIRQHRSEISDEHPILKIKPNSYLDASTKEYIPIEEVLDVILYFSKEFKLRFLNLLSYYFKDLRPSLVLSILYSFEDDSVSNLNYSDSDISRIKKFSESKILIWNVLDLIPGIARWFFMNPTREKLPILHQGIFVLVGLQHKRIEEAAKIMNIEVFQINNIFSEIAKVICELLEAAQL